jgi:hypothetical protein
VKRYQELGRQAEDAVRGIRDKDLRREAFRILLLQFMAGGDGTDRGKRSARKIEAKSIKKSARLNKSDYRAKTIKAASRPGRRGGGVATVAIQKLIDAGTFKIGRDAAGIMKELARRRIILQPSQLRMVLLRFTRSKKLKRRIKMKGKKVTYLYSAK